MNKYYKWYLTIVKYRQQHILSKKDCYCEIHHIIPKSLNGSNDSKNLVTLSAREHYICHCLLVKHYEYINDKYAYNKMLLAWNRLSHDKRHIKINSRLYEKLRIKNSIRAKQYKPTMETLIKIRNANLGKKATIETKLKQSKSLIGKTKPESMKNAVSKRVKNTTVIYNPITNTTKQIKVYELDKFLKAGWLHQHSPKVKINKKLETSGKNNPCYNKKWIYNVKTDEQLYLDAKLAANLVKNTTIWKYGLCLKYLAKLKTRKTRSAATEKEKQHKSEIMKNKVWMFNPKTNKRLRPNLQDVKKYLDDGWILKSKKYKESDFL